MSYIFLGFMIFAVNQAPITPDSIITQLYGDISDSVSFTVQTVDPDNDKISYQFDWGDGNLSDWSDYKQSGYMYVVNHLYNQVGDFFYRVRVKDDKNNISDWSSSGIITIKPLLLWKYPTNSGIYSGIAIGNQQEIYLTTEQGELLSINSDGVYQWSYQTLSSIYSAPVIGKNAVYITANDGKIYAIDFKGKELWRYQTNSSITSTPAIDKSGIIYFGCDDGNLYALNQSGKLLWTYKTGDFIGGSPVIDANGTIYIGSDAIYAVSAKGKKQWTFYPAEEDEVYFSASPTIDSDGTIYLTGTDGAVYAITKQGRLKWQATTPDEDAMRAGIAVNKNGILFFGAENGILYKKDKYGEISPVYETDYNIYSTPAIDSIGNIYFISDDGYFYILQNDGKLLFKLQIADDSKDIWYSPSPIISADGIVYFGSWQGNLYALKAFAPPAKSAWPFFRYNQQNTGRKQK